VASFVSVSNDRCLALMLRAGAERDEAAEAQFPDGDTIVFRHRKGGAA
jgi:hypothetical protein